MTSYFDDHTTQVSEAASTKMPDEDFLFFIGNIEREVIREVNLVTGDREFPDDLREKIQSIIAVYRTTPVGPNAGPLKPRKAAIEEALQARECPLLSELHSAFHIVGSRRIQTRFGILSDHPKVNLSMRAEHDGSVMAGGDPR